MLNSTQLATVAVSHNVLPQAQLAPLSQLAPLYILLVDDDAYMCELLKEMLSELGIGEVYVAGSGQRGLEIFMTADPKPNLLLCDLCMPGMDGFQFLSKMAAKRYTGDVVIISSYNQQAPESGEWALANYKASSLKLAEKLARLQGLRVRATIEKPISRERLGDLISLIRHSR